MAAADDPPAASPPLDDDSPPDEELLDAGTEPASSTATTDLLDVARDRLGHLVKRGIQLLPWGSLVVGLVGALIMDRSPGSAILVVPAAMLGWLAMLGFGLIARVDPDHYTGRRATLIKAARLGVLVGMQSLMQQCLFFALPFYVLAASFVPGHVAFLVLLASACAVTLWDPLYEAIVEVPTGRFALQVLATFTSLNAMFPALGMSNRWSLILSGVIAALGVPVQTWLFTEGAAKRKVVVWAGAAGCVLIPAFLLLGGAASIPPAPLRLVEGAMGTRYSQYTVQDATDELTGRPSQLVCASAVSAPHGLKEELVHVWRHPDGHETDRIPLIIRGGRSEGFRTWSRKARLGANPWGTWTCSVVTASGQLVGRRSIELLEPSGTAK